MKGALNLCFYSENLVGLYGTMGLESTTETVLVDRSASVQKGIHFCKIKHLCLFCLKFRLLEGLYLYRFHVLLSFLKKHFH